MNRLFIEELLIKILGFLDETSAVSFKKSCKLFNELYWSTSTSKTAHFKSYNDFERFKLYLDKYKLSPTFTHYNFTSYSINLLNLNTYERQIEDLLLDTVNTISITNNDLIFLNKRQVSTLRILGNQRFYINNKHTRRENDQIKNLEIFNLSYLEHIHRYNWSNLKNLHILKRKDYDRFDTRLYSIQYCNLGDVLQKSKLKTIIIKPVLPVPILRFILKKLPVTAKYLKMTIIVSLQGNFILELDQSDYSFKKQLTLELDFFDTNIIFKTSSGITFTPRHSGDTVKIIL
jgi:hypothetical protein